jgi:hypothetical protein
MENGVGPAGMWWEGAPVYHFYTLTAHHYLLEAARRAGTDLYDRPAVLAMFAAPARQLLPDGTFAPLNDSDRVPISRYRALLELGYARYGLDTLAPLLAPRTSEEALMWGVPEVEPGEAAARTASYAEAADHLAVLRTGDGEAMALLDYGPAMGGHAHPASLNLVVYAAGDLRLIDPGRTAYGHALQDAWYKRTVAHNTVLVDGRGHRLSQGRLLAWDDAGDRVVARTRTEKAYDGVLLDRTVVMTGDWLLDIVHARSDTSRTFDLLSHFGGTPEGVDAGAPTELYDENGYQHIEEPRVASGLGAFTLATGDGALAVRMAGHVAAFLGAGRHDADHKRHPLVVRRAEGATATFAMLMALRPGVDLPRLVVEEAADAWPRVAAGTVVVRVADDALEVDGEAVAAAPD